MGRAHSRDSKPLTSVSVVLCLPPPVPLLLCETQGEHICDPQREVKASQTWHSRPPRVLTGQTRALRPTCSLADFYAFSVFPSSHSCIPSKPNSMSHPWTPLKEQCAAEGSRKASKDEKLLHFSNITASNTTRLDGERRMWRCKNAEIEKRYESFHRLPFGHSCRDRGFTQMFYLGARQDISNSNS